MVSKFLFALLFPARDRVSSFTVGQVKVLIELANIQEKIEKRKPPPLPIIPKSAETYLPSTTLSNWFWKLFPEDEITQEQVETIALAIQVLDIVQKSIMSFGDPSHLWVNNETGGADCGLCAGDYPVHEDYCLYTNLYNLIMETNNEQTK